MLFKKSSDISIKKNIKANPPLRFAWSDKTTKNAVFGNEGINEAPKHALFIGKIEEVSTSRSCFNYNTWLDTDFPSVIMIYGRRGTGKSYSLGVIAEGLISKSPEISTSSLSYGCLLIDHMSQFWQMGFSPPSSAKEQNNEIKNWGLKPAGFSNIQVFVPNGVDRHLEQWRVFSIAYSDLDIEDWCGLLGADPFEDRQGQLMSSAFAKVTRNGWTYVYFDEEGDVDHTEERAANEDYQIGDLIDCIQNDEELTNRISGYAQETRRAVTSRLGAIESWRIFSTEGTTISEIFREGIMTIMSLGEADEKLKTLITGILVKKIFKARAKARTREELKRVTGKKVEGKTIPPGWILIDEAQNYCPREGIASSKPWLIKFAKEGRSLGLGLVVATQQPSALDSKLTSQINVLICHGLQLANDVTAVKDRILNDMADEIYINGDKIKATEKLTTVLRNLTRGEALVSSTGVNRCFFLKLRPRISAHGGAPSEIK